MAVARLRCGGWWNSSDPAPGIACAAPCQRHHGAQFWRIADLGRVNCFIGANGAGKSNILEALGILARCPMSDLRIALVAEGPLDRTSYRNINRIGFNLAIRLP